MKFNVGDRAIVRSYEELVKEHPEISWSKAFCEKNAGSIVKIIGGNKMIDGKNKVKAKKLYPNKSNLGLNYEHGWYFRAEMFRKLPLYTIRVKESDITI